MNISNYPWWASLNTVFKMPNNLYKGDPNEAPLRDMTLQGCWCLDFNELHTNIEMSENLFDEIGILLNYRSTIDVDYINNKCPVIFNFINDIELAWPDVDKDYKYQNKQFLNSLKFNIRRVRPEIYELYKKIVKTLYDNKSLEKDNVKSDWFSVFITSDEFHEYDNCPRKQLVILDLLSKIKRMADSRSEKLKTGFSHTLNDCRVHVDSELFRRIMKEDVVGKLKWLKIKTRGMGGKHIYVTANQHPVF